MVSVVIPIHNASQYLVPLLQRLREQTLPHQLILIDSESDQATQQILENENIRVHRIKKTEFNHGATRNIGLFLCEHETVVFLTQDALPASSETLRTLVDMLNCRPDVSMAYGRQLPYPKTGVFGRFARITNYPDVSLFKNKSMIPLLGIKTCSCSNSFAAYKKSELLSLGGFPTDTILGEDVSVAARFILQGKSLAYCADAQVFHSHDYTVVEEFKRYFDIGVFHREQEDVLSKFTEAETEGLKYVIQEWKYLLRNGYFYLLPSQLVRSIAKYVGYRLGSWEKHLPIKLKRSLSMHQSFWK